MKNGVLYFHDPIEFMVVDVWFEGETTVLALTREGVIRVPGGRCIRPRTLKWSDGEFQQGD